MNVKFIEPALLELDDAIKYYNEELDGLGARFYKEVLSTIELIKLFSDSWNKCSANTRKAIVKTFPYNLVYAVDGKTIVIISVAHHHREAEYWIDRII
jgi:mRNA-degrading endonuclease RelE of RelBE toxin-antitoxin system